MNQSPPDSQLVLALTHPHSLDQALVAAFLKNVPYSVYFKDLHSHYIAVSQSLVTQFGCKRADEIVGKSDFDFFQHSEAQKRFEDEQAIIRSGEPSINKNEKCVWANGSVCWANASTMPLRNKQGQIVGTFGISKDITAEKQMEAALQQTRKEVMDASRLTGMNEVANGVLHNVGNVLNSLNVSASVITTGLRQSKAESLGKISALLQEHKTDLAAFLTRDPKGTRIPEFLVSLANHGSTERLRLLKEIEAMQKNVDHIKEIISVQQSYATMAGNLEPLDAVELMEDSLRMNRTSLVRHDVEIVCKFEPVPPILAERGKVLQILINLIRNAKCACDDSASPKKIITLHLLAPTPNLVQLIVQDNGVGIPPENLTRIFNHGFTTRATGHGFGLHSSANAAQELNGSLTVDSAGRGLGARFTLELPAAQITTEQTP